LVIFAPTSVAAKAATIAIAMDYPGISPAKAATKAGDIIEWVNRDAFDHTATAQYGVGRGHSLEENREAVLKKAESIDYYCRFRPHRKTTLTIVPP
jgi:plastocyanin